MIVRRAARPGLIAAAIAVALGAVTTRSYAQTYTGASFGGSPAAVPGTIQLANFDDGGEGTAYHDTTPGNAGGAYRNTDVDIASSSEGGFTIGWIDPGEWLNYTVNVASSGAYTVKIRVAAPGGGTSLHIGFNKSPGSWTSVSIPSTGGWQSWMSVSVPMTLTAGVQQMTLAFDTGWYNVSYVDVSSDGGPPPTLTPYGGSPAPVPGTIQVANFDNGGEGLAYHDTTPGNAGGMFRMTDVDIANSTEGGYTVGWIDPGEWLNYTVNVASTGSYTAQIRIAAPSGGTSLHIGFNKSPGSWTAVSIPATGSWESFTTVSVPLTLTAGEQQMTLQFDSGWYNVSYVNVTAASSSGGGGTLRMITWNIDQGYTDDSQTNYVLPTQMSFIAAQNADVIVFQEVATWREYQPTRIPALLQAATGQTWYSVWVPTPACATTGCLGELILSRIPISDYTTTYLTPSSAGRALIYVGGVPINILTTHLEYYDLSLRTTQLNQLMSFARGFGGPRLVGGDFNSWWGEYWILQMESEYHDSWFDITNNRDGGYTTGNVRFDYIFRSFDNDLRVTPTNAFVVNTALSDHRPLVVDFTVR